MARYDPYEELLRERRGDYTSSPPEPRRSFWQYLKTRPIEVWLFFAAGLVIGRILF